MATHSSIIDWRVPWTEEPGRLQTMGSQRARQDWSHLACMQCLVVCVRYKRSFPARSEHMTWWSQIKKSMLMWASIFWIVAQPSSLVYEFKPLSVFFSFSFNRRCLQLAEEDFLAEPIVLAALGFLFDFWLFSSSKVLLKWINAFLKVTF